MEKGTSVTDLAKSTTEKGTSMTNLIKSVTDGHRKFTTKTKSEPDLVKNKGVFPKTGMGKRTNAAKIPSP